ncbi:hypothetical protein FEM48_Zijuj06G0093800 [Ziziphus jujuba var. spinosa]|uniref:Uncharacterized protein n=1 Tax=Ziziphus jujuba var. spinosa TaxID=714518 RepID=A0A978V8G3_ZIZJJ|nr:hypothetical protein FEM48_Zijuj06G0093800 [Ziziphus jujuba var. spinosa]
MRTLNWPVVKSFSFGLPKNKMFLWLWGTISAMPPQPPVRCNQTRCINLYNSYGANVPNVTYTTNVAYAISPKQYLKLKVVHQIS